MIFSADFNHELHSPQVECSEIGSFAARNSGREVQFRQHICRLIEQERIERCRKYSLGDFDDLAEYAKTLGFPNPNKATKFKARKLVLALLHGIRVATWLNLLKMARFLSALLQRKDIASPFWLNLTAPHRVTCSVGDRKAVRPIVL